MSVTSRFLMRSSTSGRPWPIFATIFAGTPFSHRNLTVPSVPTISKPRSAKFFAATAASSGFSLSETSMRPAWIGSGSPAASWLL